MTTWTREMAVELAREEYERGLAEGRTETSSFRDGEQYGRQRVLRYLREWLVNRDRYDAEPVTVPVMLERVDAMLAGVEQDRVR